MVSINSLKINESSNSIDVDVNTTVGNIINQVLLWDIKTFKDYSEAVRLSSFLTNTDEKEVFSIPASNLDLTNITGLFFLEFTSNEPTDNISLGVVSNFIPYYECLLNKALKVEVKSCVNDYDLLLLSALINSLNSAIKSGFYEESVKLIEKIEDLCDVCYNCIDYENTKLVNGLGFGTIDNSVILV